ncbi:predicted D-glycerate permease [Oscillibacter sp. PC13]|uniref:GntP family permease n=1 Tax=Oscillibacter sp. PC13 TaxID=1855299 RepID=UPI0008E2B91F|nr:SLC13 family permease [Oscillibacter sp. PC13]SFP29938.1 predicted D-glycerate permease [Oscillibacter sp. PC13]
MSAGVFLVVLVAAILVLMLMIIKLKVHPVMALFTTALLTGIVLGYGVSGTADMIGSGFGGTLGSIGITIILGGIISMAIEDTGAAKVIANFFIKLFRGKNMELAPALTAFIMSIPVFGDITMVLTAPIASMLSKRKHISMSTMASFTGLGLFLTHGLVPPTPGILAIAIMFEADLGMTIVWGVVVALIGFFGTWLVLKRWTEKEWIEPNPEMVKGLAETDSDSIDDILIKDPNLPGTFVAFLPLLLPVALISLSSFASMYADPEGAFYAVCTTIGHKVIALFIGVLYSLWLAYKQRKAVLAAYQENFPNEADSKVSEIALNKWVARGLLVCLSPLLITAMGGAFGTVLKSAPALAPLSEMVGNSPIPAILIPWAVAVIMMTAVGSMTTAGMTAAGIVLPMLPSLGLSPLAAVLAIGAGTLAFDHVSNSGFWVMGQFFHLDTKQSLKYVTIPSAVASVICIIAIAIFNAVGLLG